MDWSQLLGGNTPGLLSPEQQGSVNNNAIESMAAALLKAAGPSIYKGKMTTASGIGEGRRAPARRLCQTQFEISAMRL
jgi:hypothetical protein